MNPYTTIIGVLKHCGWGQGLKEEREFPKLCLGAAIGVVADMHNPPFTQRTEDRENYEYLKNAVASAILDEPYRDHGDSGMDIITVWNDAPGRIFDHVLHLLEHLQDAYEVTGG